MYTPEQQQLRMSLTQFFGAILTNSNLKDPSMKKQSLVALVIEELLKACKNEDGTIDMVAAKPIIKSTHYLLEQRSNDIHKELTEKDVADHIKEDATSDLDWMVQDLKKYIDSLQDIK